MITTLLFIGMHTQYFKTYNVNKYNRSKYNFRMDLLSNKQYFSTFSCTFLMNIGMTLLFKYNLIKVKH